MLLKKAECGKDTRKETEYGRIRNLKRVGKHAVDGWWLVAGGGGRRAGRVGGRRGEVRCLTHGTHLLWCGWSCAHSSSLGALRKRGGGRYHGVKAI